MSKSAHERSNLNTMTIILKSIISCEVLGLWESFQGTCFKHAFLKACQYTTMDEKVYKGLKNVFIKSIQGDFQKCITQFKKSRKGDTSEIKHGM